MADATNKLVTVIGGSGFVGRHLVRALAQRGYRIRPAMRRPDLAGHLQPLGSVGQIMPVQANVRYPDSVLAACQGADIVINLTGILSISGSQTFDAIHVSGAEASARAAKQAGANSFIQMSAIGADAGSSSTYARTKAEGEARAKALFPGAIIVRPSVIFGPEDDLFNRFAGLARIAPALPLIGGGETLFQPVFVGDVADGMSELATHHDRHAGKTFEFGGPVTMSLKQIMEFTLKTTARRRFLAPLPFGLAKMMAAVLGLLPKPLLTMDQVELLKSDNIVSEACTADGRTLEGLGISPQGIESIVPSYLYRYRKAGQFTRTTNA
ncbi:MAG: complex I NDUFA9 subunit family protein [Rhizobiales bacterium]|nr:complex I NDUFA9 subunit family protein [Hyphomicrobiales bacterium]